jgi:hypothetical protein
MLLPDLLPSSVAWAGMEQEEERLRTSKRRRPAFRDAEYAPGRLTSNLQNRCTDTVLTRHADNANAV